ncbi:GntR family transcriptional regulator [Streptomyces sp. NPDC001978]|uniref:GntR family transcriptional regulator n=1 Tax=Streptomyces sp. NPDC001978 TaxID=3364627 RepID=UPI0036C8019F
MDWDPKRPRWQQIADVLRQRITDGTYPPDTMISESAITQEWGVARITARKAVAALRAEGLVTTVPGMGSFVL